MIVFGFKREWIMQAGLKNARYVETEEDVSRTRAWALKEKLGVILMHESLKVGTDIKFKTDAHVVILTDHDRLDGEDVI